MIFDSQEACERHEQTLALLRPLFDPKTGEKRAIEDYQEFFEAVSGIWLEIHGFIKDIHGGLTDEEVVACNVAALLEILHKSSEIEEAGDITGYGKTMRILGKYLEKNA